MHGWLVARMEAAHQKVSAFPSVSASTFDYEVCIPVWATKLPYQYPLRVGKADGSTEAVVSYSLLPNGHTLIQTSNGGELTKIFGASAVYGKLEDLPKYMDLVRPFWYVLTDPKFVRLEYEKYRVEWTALWVGYELHDYNLLADADRHLAFMYFSRMLRNVGIGLEGYNLLHGAQTEAILGKGNPKPSIFVCTLRTQTLDRHDEV